jgi:hypothetical protein
MLLNVMSHIFTLHRRDVAFRVVRAAICECMSLVRRLVYYFGFSRCVLYFELGITTHVYPGTSNVASQRETDTLVSISLYDRASMEHRGSFRQSHAREHTSFLCGVVSQCIERC